MGAGSAFLGILVPPGSMGADGRLPVRAGAAIMMSPVAADLMGCELLPEAPPEFPTFSANLGLRSLGRIVSFWPLRVLKST